MNGTKPIKPRYRVELEALADDCRPAPVRLKAVLKFALRAMRLRCVRLIELSPETSAAPETAQS